VCVTIGNSEALRRQAHKSTTGRLHIKITFLSHDTDALAWRSDFLADPYFSSDDMRFRSYYQVGDVIGEGKQAIVKRGLQLHDNSACAIKIIDKSRIGLHEIEHATTEFRLVQQLHHENIIKMYDMYNCQHHIYLGMCGSSGFWDWIAHGLLLTRHLAYDPSLVMELAGGSDLLDYLNTQEQFCLDECQARLLIHQCLSALAYIHSLSYIHGDIKPENFVFANDSYTSVCLASSAIHAIDSRVAMDCFVSLLHICVCCCSGRL
jgi:serine/threonine protein kinase